MHRVTTDFDSNSDDLALQSYALDLEAVAESYLGQPITDATLVQMRGRVNEVRNGFLGRHPQYNAFGPIEFTTNGHGVTFNARVEHRIDTEARIKRENERAKLIAELQAKSAAQEARDAKRHKHMEKLHRKLFAKHKDHLPHGVKHIWGTLSMPQQYILLKDIDWHSRHDD